MNIIDWTNKVFSNDRALLRCEVINEFLAENPGSGKGANSSKYKYIVARIGGHEIYLQRPAQFNNGFDFTLNVSGLNFNPNGRATTRPTHINIIEDLRLKKQENEAGFQILTSAIDQIFLCSPLTMNVHQLRFQSGLPVAILLECIKWLFVEQDVTYWNYSGRKMFFDEISNI